MKLPKFTPQRFASVALISFFASTTFFLLYTSVAPIPIWLGRLDVPIWLVRCWPLGTLPLLFLLTWLAKKAVARGFAQWSTDWSALNQIRPLHGPTQPLLSDEQYRHHFLRRD